MHSNLIVCKGYILELIFLSVPNWFILTNLNKWSWCSDGLKRNSIFSWDDRTDGSWCCTTPHCAAQLPTVSPPRPTCLWKIRMCESSPETVFWPGRHREGGTSSPQPCFYFQEPGRQGSQTSMDEGVIAHLRGCFSGYEQQLLVKAHAWVFHSATFTV